MFHLKKCNIVDMNMILITFYWVVGCCLGGFGPHWGQKWGLLRYAVVGEMWCRWTRGDRRGQTHGWQAHWITSHRLALNVLKTRKVYWNNKWEVRGGIHLKCRVGSLLFGNHDFHILKILIKILIKTYSNAVYSVYFLWYCPILCKNLCEFKLE